MLARLTFIMVIIFFLSQNALGMEGNFSPRQQKAMKGSYAHLLKSPIATRRKAQSRHGIKSHYLDPNERDICMRSKKVMSFEEFKLRGGYAILSYKADRSRQRAEIEAKNEERFVIIESYDYSYVPKCYSNKNFWIQKDSFQIVPEVGEEKIS